MLTGPNVILVLKIAVATVTVLLLASLVALAAGRYRLHGRINVVFFVLTLSAVLGLEVVIRFVDPHLFDYLDEPARDAMRVHLSFSVPSAVLLLAMLPTGLRRWRFHPWLGGAFLVLWAGTFVTGIFFLPHTPP